MRSSKLSSGFDVAGGPALEDSAANRLRRWFAATYLAAWGRALCAKRAAPAEVPVDQISEEPAEAVPEPEADDVNSAQSLVERMLLQKRYTLLLRPQLIVNLTAEQLARARTGLADSMCVVPGGEVVARPTDAEAEESSAAQPSSLRVDGYYLDRHPVTNAEYYAFVAGGGYEQMAIWDREIWPALLEFVDQTGKPGPRFWHNGRHPRGEERHPVVGVSWYEAAAYARWVGKRLPSDAEWVKAASWPVAISGGPLVQRRYPWGDAMDRNRANLWGGPGRTVSVDDYPSGVSVGGVQQMIGNVWEWTADSLTLADPADPQSASAQTILKSIRGGAFDTYLDCQATAHFQSGDSALARKHNISFRCAISWNDLSPIDAGPEPAVEEHVGTSLVEVQS